MCVALQANTRRTQKSRATAHMGRRPPPGGITTFSSHHSFGVSVHVGLAHLRTSFRPYWIGERDFAVPDGPSQRVEVQVAHTTQFIDVEGRMPDTQSGTDDFGSSRH